MIIYKKHPAHDQEAQAILHEVRQFLSIACEEPDIFHIYHFQNNRHDEQIIQNLFDSRYGSIIKETPQGTFFIKDKEGQYNQTQDQTLRYLKAVLGLETDLRYYKGYKFDVSDTTALDKIKAYLFNPLVEEEIKPEDIHFNYEESSLDEHQAIEGFNSFSHAELQALKERFGVGLDPDDLEVIQAHFIKENRDPRLVELKILDTYWSDHCRHTTFLTNIDEIEFLDGHYRQVIQDSFQNYLESRAFVYEGKTPKPISLMDLATINAKELKKRGMLDDLEESSEINACSVEVDIEVNGETQRWLQMFKNETHNHPTEIEPYGGAHTCIGGCIRDPLSGRAEVIQGIRVVGSGNPLTPHSETLEGKLPQRYIATRAMQGFSDYANQIGAPVGLIKEYYDDGFTAKRMELGALLAAVPKANVRREEGQTNDLVLLLGAPTGRDGLGAAVGSSSVQNKHKMSKVSAEVQRGNPFAERKIIRLFKRPELTRLIKKCNDFGAGGVSVAIGELADGLDINLNAVHTKYPGMNGYEIALSESQERMAVIIAPEDLTAFTRICDEEDLDYTPVAQVTNTGRMRMFWNGEMIVDLDRNLLNSNGATKHASVRVNTEAQTRQSQDENTILNRSIGKTLSQHFDSSLGRNAVLSEYGGRLGLSAQDGIVTKFPVENTNTASVMTHACFPQFARHCAYHGGYYAVLQSVVKAIALTGKYHDVRLSLQEFFPSIKNDPERMALPFISLLGAFEVMKNLNIPAIGGKDSMSGSWHGIDVPPTLVSFAVNTVDSRKVVSREFKKAGSSILITKIARDEFGLVDFAQFKRVMTAFGEMHQAGRILAASAVSEHGVRFTIEDMALGNSLQAHINPETSDEFSPANLILEVSENSSYDKQFFEKIGHLSDGDSQTGLICARSSAYHTLYVDILENKPNILPVFEERPLKPLKLNNKKVLIPVLDGATGEYDLQRAFERAGFDVSQQLILTGSHQAYLDSLKALAANIEKSSVFAIPHGEYFASVAVNFSGAMANILRNPAIKSALETLKARQGFIMGFGAGMAALIDADYFGDIKDNFVFTSNKRGKYIHTMIDVTVIKNSYFSSSAHRQYSAPVSGKQLTILCKDLEKLSEKVDIISMNTISKLPLDCGVDSIGSKCGHIFAIRSLIERMDDGLYRNTGLSGMPKHFELLARHFE